MPEVFSLDLFVTTKTLLKQSAENALIIVLHALGKRAGGWTGGFLRIFLAMDSGKGPRGWHEVFSDTVGTQKDQRSWEKYQIISMEKAIRLMKRHAKDGHISSWQSRNEAEWEYGGAFIVEVYIHELATSVKILVSFSGLPEEGDEAQGLLTIKGMAWPGSCSDILVASNNQFAANLLDIN